MSLVTVHHVPVLGEVWCKFAELYAVTRDGFCEFCGDTDHPITAPDYQSPAPCDSADYTGGIR